MKIIDFIKKYWLAVIITIAVIIILLAFFKPNPDRDLRKHLEKENKDIQAELKRSHARESILRKDSIAIRQRMKKRNDSTDKVIAQKDKNIAQSKKLNREINYRMATDVQLDSIRAATLRRKFVLRPD